MTRRIKDVSAPSNAFTAKLRRCAAVFSLATLAACACAHAQATFAEGFDTLAGTSSTNGPQELSSRGWVFRNQSNPAGSYAYFAVYPGLNPIYPTANAGSTFVAVQDTAAGGYQSPLSAWAVLPIIPGQRAGDLITFWAYADIAHTTLEVRYSPGGGVSTGSGASAVGDFSQVLGVVAAHAPSWTQHQFTVPGLGRLAFRYTGVGHDLGAYTDFLGLDTLSVGASPVPLCNMPPVPQPGQTVHWTAAAGPYRLCQSITIAATATVIVDAGVRVDADANRQIVLNGTLVTQGSVAAPVMLAAAVNSVPLIVLEGGTLQTSQTDIRGQVRPMADGKLDLSDTTFTGPNGLIFTDLYSGTGFARMKRVTFTNSEFTITNYTLNLSDVTLNNSTARLIRDYPFISNIVADGKPFDVDATPQGTLLDTITVRNVTSPPGGQTTSTGYGLGLSEGNYFVGPTVALTNNTYPARITSAGILPGSVLPATGNINNMIYVPGRDHHGNSIWSDAGVPYFIPEFYSQHGGALRIGEGASVKLAAGAGMAGDPSLVSVLGTEERPVSFGQAVAGARWYPLQNFHRIRHATLDGALRGAAWASQLGWGFIDSSTVRDCSEYGVTGQAIIRKTLFQNNGVGASVSFNQIDLDGATNPNGFEGNTIGVAAAGNARGNWWNSPTGPTSADNPGGAGDLKAQGVPFLPFRTTRPDFSDAPPIVDITKHSFMATPGQKFVLTWEARDDGLIVSQRVVMVADGDVVQGNLIEPVVVVADNLPGTQHSVEIAINEPQSRYFGAGNIRVEVTDNAGQVGWDDTRIYIESSEPGQLALTSPVPAAATAGQDLGPVCWNAQGIRQTGGSVEAYLQLENSGDLISLGGVTTYLSCLPLSLTAPFVSTDRARIVLSLFTGGGVGQPEYFYGPTFAIRPDTRIEDAPPTVSIVSPAAGTGYPGGAVVPLRWTAGDDQFVRAVHIQGSTDGGRTWSFIARDLAGNRTAYDWQLPPSTGITDVRVKVIAVDRRFQDTSSVVQVSVLPGNGAPACVSDFNGTGTVTVQDIFDFLNAYFTMDIRADVNHAGGVTVQDIFDFLAAYFAGCP